MGCTDSTERVAAPGQPQRREPPLQQQEQQQRRPPAVTPAATAPAAVAALTTTALAPSPAVLLPASDGKWQDRFAKFVVDAPKALSRDVLITNILSQELGQATSTETDLHIVCRELIDHFPDAECLVTPSARVAFNAAIVAIAEKNSFSACDNESAVPLEQDYIEALYLQGVALCEKEDHAAAFAALNAARRHQQAYNPGKADRFTYVFYGIINYCHMQVEKKHPDVRANDEMIPLGFLQSQLDYFKLITNAFLDTAGQGFDDETEKDRQVPPGLRVDASNVYAIGLALSDVVFTFQEFLARVDVPRWIQIARDALDVMKKVLRVVQADLDIDDSSTIMLRLPKEDGPNDTVHPLKSAVYFALVATDAIYSLTGEYSQLRHHMPELTAKVCENAYGWSSDQHTNALTSAVFSVLCGGPPAAAYPILAQLETVFGAYFGSINFCDPDNFAKKDQVAEAKWHVGSVASVHNFLVQKLFLWKESNKNCRTEMTAMAAFSSVVLALPRVVDKDHGVASPVQIHNFKMINALSRQYLKMGDDSNAVLMDRCREGIAFCHSLGTSSSSSSSSSTSTSTSTVSAVDKAVCCTTLCLCWSFKEHWDMLHPLDGKVEMLPQHCQALAIIKMARNFLEQGVATRENRDDVPTVEFIALALADCWERSQDHLLRNDMYKEFDVAVDAAIRRGNPFAAATSLHHKALLMRKLDSMNEQADSEVRRACQLMIDKLTAGDARTGSDSESNKTALPNHRLVLLEDTFTVLKLFEPKWFSGAVASVCEAGAAELLKQARDDDSAAAAQGRKSWRIESAAVLLVSAGACLHHVGPSKRKQGWNLINRALHLVFNGLDANHEEVFAFGAGGGGFTEFQNDFMTKICEVTNQEPGTLFSTMAKWMGQ